MKNRIAQTVGFIIPRFLVVLHCPSVAGNPLFYQYYYTFFCNYCQDFYLYLQKEVIFFHRINKFLSFFLFFLLGFYNKFP